MTGIGLILLSATAFGFMPVLAKVAYQSGADIYTFLALRFAMASVVLWAWVLVRHLAIPRGRLLLGIILLGSIGYVGQSFAFFSSIQHADISIIAGVAYTYPVFVMLLSVLTHRDRLTVLKVAALITAVVGAVLVVGGGGHAELVGILFVLAANTIYAAYYIISQRLIPDGYAIGASVTIITSAAAVYAIVLLVGQQLHPPGTTLGWAALLGVTLGPTIVGITAFLAGLQRLTPMTTATVAAVEPVVTVLLAVIWLGEIVGPLRLVGLVLVIGAVVVVAGWSRMPAASLEPTRHR